MFYLSEVLLIQGKYSDAANRLTYLIPEYVRRRGESSPLVMTQRVNYAAALVGLGKYADAEKVVELAIAKVDKTKAHPVMSSRADGLFGVAIVAPHPREKR